MDHGTVQLILTLFFQTEVEAELAPLRRRPIKAYLYALAILNSSLLELTFFPSPHFPLGYDFYSPGATQHHRTGGTPKIQQGRDSSSDKRGGEQTTTPHGFHGQRDHRSTAPTPVQQITPEEEADNGSEDEEDKVEDEAETEVNNESEEEVEEDDQQSSDTESEEAVEEDDDQQSSDNQSEATVEEEAVIMAATQPQVSGGQLSSILPYSGNPGLEGLAFICLLYTSPSPRD